MNMTLTLGSAMIGMALWSALIAVHSDKAWDRIAAAVALTVGLAVILNIGLTH